MKLYGLWTSGLEGDAIKYISYLEPWQPLCSVTRASCEILIEGIIRNDSEKLF